MFDWGSVNRIEFNAGRRGHSFVVNYINSSLSMEFELKYRITRSYLF